MWFYQDKEVTSIEDMPEGTFGFIYKVTHTPTNKSYIGKKVLYHNQKKKLTKKELAEQTGPGRKPSTKVVTKESDWKTYYGSSKPIIELVKNGEKDNFNREILMFINNKKLLSYYETKHLFINNVLETPDLWFNDNIAGKYFTRDFIS
jgi:hypothetical protein